MNRNWYQFGIFFIGLSIAVSILSGLLQINLGTSFYTLHSVIPWLINTTLIHVIINIILLKYYHNREYWVTFSTGILSLIASIIFYSILISMLSGKPWSNNYTLAYLNALGTGILYGISLVFSRAGKQSWLKTAGILGSILLLILFTTYIWILDARDVHIKGTLENIHKITSFVQIVIPFFFIMNFLSELKSEKAVTSPRKALNYIMVFVGTLAIILTLYFGFRLTSESNTSSYWEKRNLENAQSIAQLFEARTFKNSKGDSLPYRLLKPLDYDPNKKYPLVVILHHGGLHGTDNISQLSSQPAPLLSIDINRKKYPSFLFVPQCPRGLSWGGIRSMPSADSLVLETISVLEDEFSIDVKRRYIAGISGGGYGTWHLICIRPQMFAAAIPICGAGDAELAAKIIDVPVWSFHGSEDNLVPVAGDRDMIEAIKNAGGDPRYTEFPSAGHNIWNDVQNTQGLLEWLFEQKRD